MRESIFGSPSLSRYSEASTSEYPGRAGLFDINVAVGAAHDLPIPAEPCMDNVFVAICQASTVLLDAEMDSFGINIFQFLTSHVPYGADQKDR